MFGALWRCLTCSPNKFEGTNVGAPTAVTLEQPVVGQQHIHSHDDVHWYMGELTSRIVAQSGIPSDRHHLGKIILQGLRDDPDFVLQIDGGTDSSETNGSVLRRSIQCATSFRNMGLKRGDVIVLMAPAHLDLAIPFYAAFYVGVAVAPVDYSLGVYELQSTFEMDRPKIIFCQSDKHDDVQQALDNLKMDATIITFDKRNEGFSFSEMLEQYGNDVQDFKAEDFDPDETIAILISTSGTTGSPKAAIHTHKNMASGAPYAWSLFTKFPTPLPSVLTMAPLHWLSTILNFLMSPFLKYARVQSSLTLTPQHVYDLINKYRPASMGISPTRMTILLKPGQERDQCDFSCLEFIMLGGSAVHSTVMTELKKVSPNTEVAHVFGLTEAYLPFHGTYDRPGSSGTRYARYGAFQYKLVNTETQEEIIAPNVPGELWLKGPCVFKGYYNRPEDTKEAMTKDDWFKTGDMLYRDENWNYFFVERIKLFLKCRGYQISPEELEKVIIQHPGVLEVAVTGIPHEEFGELPVACVVRRPGSDVSAQEVKDLVKGKLADSKQLRGGVVFMKELPMTTSTKIHRRKLKEMVLNMDRE